MGRLIATICAALLGWSIGKALNVPVWRDWDIGDRSDLAMLSAAVVWYGLGYLRARSVL